MPRQSPDFNERRGSLAEKMGIHIVSAESARVMASMPVAGNTQPFGLLHGGASAVLAETVGSIAATLHADSLHPGSAAVGVSLSCTHHKAARDGSVHAVAVPVSLGRTLATHRIEIRNDSGALVCSAQLTCLLRPPER
jgi:1,4-dihydroxy-2-naphthoyl-CoA hydrolase